MSSKSKGRGSTAHFFSRKMMLVSLVMVVVFGTIIFFYPLIFSPSQLEQSTNPAPSETPVTSAPATK